MHYSIVKYISKWLWKYSRKLIYAQIFWLKRDFFFNLFLITMKDWFSDRYHHLLLATDVTKLLLEGHVALPVLWFFIVGLCSCSTVRICNPSISPSLPLHSFLLLFFKDLVLNHTERNVFTCYKTKHFEYLARAASSMFAFASLLFVQPLLRVSKKS